jgi:molybdopterin-containing oxidoreductase family iron-sulfur binding subunit
MLKVKGQVVLLTILRPISTEKLIAEFIGGNPNSKHIVYDAVSSSETFRCFEAVYGERALVDYDFSKASLIVSVGADILGDWQGGGYDSGYTSGRIPWKDVTPLSEANMTTSSCGC